MDPGRENVMVWQEQLFNEPQRVGRVGGEKKVNFSLAESSQYDNRRLKLVPCTPVVEE